MASFFRAATARLRPLAATLGASTALAAGALSVWADETSDKTTTAKGDFGVFFDDITQEKIKSAYPPKYPVLRTNKVLVDPSTKEKLQRFAGCGVKLGIECYVDDGSRQVLQLRVLEPEPFGEDTDLSHDKVYLVLSSVAVEEEDEIAGSGGANARETVVTTLNHLGHFAQGTDKWSGKVKNKSGSETLVSYESAENLELLGTLCSNKTWNAEEGTCDCECSGLTPVKPKPECGFCKFMKAGPCGLQFEVWENCIAAHKEDEQGFVNACGAITVKLKECVDAKQEYYGVLEEIAKEDEEKKEFEAEKKAVKEKAGNNGLGEGSNE